MRKYADRVASTHSRNYLGYLTDYTQWGGMISTHSRNYLGYLTVRFFAKASLSTHSRNYLGYLTLISSYYTIIPLLSNIF